MNDHVAATHSAFGLRWHIPFDMPAFSRVDDGAPADVTVSESVVERPAEGKAAGPLRTVHGTTVVFGLPGTGRMRVTDGHRVDYQPADGCTPEALRLMLMGPAAALLLQQRGFVPMHGSGVRVPGGAMLLVGHSGAGKSTTSAALQQRGYAAFADDLVPLALRDGIPLAFPGSRVMKVWSDAAQALHIDTSASPRVRPSVEKYLLPVSEIATEPIPLTMVVALDTHNRPDVEIREVHNAERFAALLDHTWQKMTIKRMGLHSEHFRTVAEIASRVRVMRVRRPTGVPVDQSTLVDDVVRLLEA